MKTTEGCTKTMTMTLTKTIKICGNPLNPCHPCAIKTWNEKRGTWNVKR